MNHIEISERLWKHGFPTYTVGGATRDMLLSDSGTSHDFDVATKATPDQIEKIFSDCLVKLVGKSFGVVLVDGVEVATFRKDMHHDLLNPRNCEVVFSDTIEDDLGRRDFTINALALCEKTGEIIDLHNGVNDLKNCVIRFVGNAHMRIMEDPNRIVRACRFLAKIEGSFASETFDALTSHAYLVGSHVAPERIRLEILKAMEVENPSLFFGALASIGALRYVFPELVRSIGHDHGNHHIENVWEHMMLAGDHVSPRFPLVRLAAFIHDIGKPGVFNHVDGTFINHENLGEKIVRFRLEELKFSIDEINTVASLVRHHMHSTFEISSKSVRKIKKKLHDDGIDVRDWIRIKIADRFGNVNKYHWTLNHLRKIVHLFLGEQHEMQVFDVKSLALSGGDLIEKFGLVPGPMIGKLQKHLLNFVLEKGFEFNTVESLTIECENFLIGVVWVFGKTPARVAGRIEDVNI